MVGRCTLPTQGLLEFVQIMACLAPASEAIFTRRALPRLLSVVNCLTYATFAQAVAGLAETLELLAVPGSSGMTTRTYGFLPTRKGREGEDHRARHR